MKNTHSQNLHFVFKGLLTLILVLAGFVSVASAQDGFSTTADLNGDGKSDLLWFNPATGQTSAWLMNGTNPATNTILQSDGNWRIITTADFNGDGMADLLWYNSVNGQTAIWIMNGSSMTSWALLPSDPNSTVTTAADFNADRKADLIWYNTVTGQTSQWLMNGTSVISTKVLLTDSAWKVTATADFNGDGMADLLWHNRISGETVMWFMNGTTLTSWSSLVVDPNWNVIATADFNGDRKSDLLWYNPILGQTVVWIMNGSSLTNWASLLIDPVWKVTSTADLNGDGMADLLWYNSISGQTVAWQMNGTSLVNWSTLLTDPKWRVTAASDLNGDRKADLIWYNPTTGQTSAWLMNGVTPISGTNLLTATSTKIVRTPTSTATILPGSDNDTSTAKSPMPPNQAPVANAGPDRSVTLPASINLTGSATDDGNPIGLVIGSWSQVSGPGSVIFSNSDSFSTNAAFSAPGTYTLRLTANDSALAGSDDVVVNVSAGNQAPVVNAGADKTVTLPAGTILTGTAVDDGLPGATLTASWTKLSGPGTVTFSSASSLISAVAFSAAGTYTLRLTVSDGLLSASDDIVVTVSPAVSANQAPAVSAGADQTITLPAGVNLFGAAVDDGLPSGSTMSVSWTKVSGPGSVIFVNSNSLSASATFLAAGTYTLRLTATDSSLSSTDDVVVVVNPSAPTNQAPVVNAGIDQTISLPAGTILVGTATDDGLPTGSAIAASWSQISGPGPVIFGNASALSTSAIFPLPGTYTLRLTASDSVLSSTDDVVVTVNIAIATNQAPVVDAGPDQTITLPSGATLLGTTIDDGFPTGSILARTWSKVSGPGTVTFGNASALSTTATFSLSGTYTLRLTVSDTALATTDDVVVVVNAVPVNQAPFVNAGPDQTITLPAGTVMAGIATDEGLPTGSTLTRTWSKVSGPGTVTFGNNALLNTSVTFSVAGTYTLRLTASDSALTTTDDVIVTVNSAVPGNQAPVVNAGADQAITLPGTALLLGTVIDDGLPTGGSLTVNWSKISGPGTVTFVSGTSLSTAATFSAFGAYTLRLTVSDSALTATDDVVINVNPPLPIISGMSPSSAAQGATSFNATITGTNLTGATGVTFSGTGVTATVNSVTPTGISVSVDIAIGAATGSRNVIVTLPGGISAALPAGFTVIAPTCGITVSGIHTLLANASDNVGVVGVQFKLDGVILGPELTAGPYSVTWNSITASNGCHTISADALDAAGNLGTSSLVVSVSNP